MAFSKTFIDSIADDPIIGLTKIIQQTFDSFDQEPENTWTEHDYSVLVEGLALVSSVLDGFGLHYLGNPPELVAEISEDCRNIREFFKHILEETKTHTVNARLNSMRSSFELALGRSFGFEFSEGDFERVQVLLNELREEVSSSAAFEEDHRRRMLKKLEKMQGELHKRVSDLDNFWSLFGSAGVAIGKFGKDAKPFTDRVREILEIVWRTEARAEELPSGSPMPTLEDGAEED